MKFAVKVSAVILCTACGYWIHERCSDVEGSLRKVQDFECSVCKAGITRQDELDLRIG